MESMWKTCFTELSCEITSAFREVKFTGVQQTDWISHGFHGILGILGLRNPGQRSQGFQGIRGKSQVVCFLHYQDPVKKTYCAK